MNMLPLTLQSYKWPCLWGFTQKFLKISHLSLACSISIWRIRAKYYYMWTYEKMLDCDVTECDIKLDVVFVVLLELHIETAAIQQFKAEIPLVISCRTTTSEFSLHVWPQEKSYCWRMSPEFILQGSTTTWVLSTFQPKLLHCSIFMRKGRIIV